MNRPIAPSLSPNTEVDDVLLAMKVMLNPFSWKKSREVAHLESDFSKLFGNEYSAHAVNSGRSALHVILEALKLHKQSEVILQAFTCLVVPNAVLANNLKPRYVDINDSYNLDPRELSSAITKNTRAVIVQHTFGIPADMKAIKKVIRQREKAFNTEIILIEDCAHSLGAYCQNNKIGTLGDIAFFSFGRDKIISSVFGGMIVTQNKVLENEVKNIIASLNTPSYFWIFQQLLHPLLFNFLILPFYNSGFNKVTIGKLMLFFFQKVNLLSRPVYKDEIKRHKNPLFPQKMPGALARLARLQLSKLNRFNKKRQEIALNYFKAGIRSPSGKINEGIFLRYPVSVANPKDLRLYAKRNGILLGDWYHEVLDPQCNLSDFGYLSDSCKHAEYLAQRVVNLPTYPTMTDKDVKKVISVYLSWKNTQ